ncbi:DNA polymerase Y family protein [Shewanella sp. FJAT-52076]|uniref:Y-family DNA polymerase n=1 Tax=Shewanella sp. FJAT-52076 TaxID=2864202 RepID=UPI001C65BB5E|nr:DNA polymerase Y family protein [Shewanella sp. FJAT-52076]QYJ73672.1 DNA polymerase Y family protein [Shewanella sp. FJAT-52076]
MRWLGVWLPHWELDYLRHVQGLAPSMPLILYDVARARVLKACPQAASAGVMAGQSMGSAAQLCPNVQPFPINLSLHRQGCDWLCRHGYSFSARLVPPPEPDTFFARCHDVLLLETGSMAKLFGGEAALAKALAAALEGLNCHFAMAFAATPLAAGMLAKTRPSLASKTLQPVFARAATSQSALKVSASKSASKAIAEPKSAAEALSRQLSALPISTLPVPEALLFRLEGMGLEHIGALQALPAAELGIRFGPEFVLLLARLNGKQPHPQSFYCPQEEYRQRLELMYEAESLNALVFMLGRMFAELALFLRQRQLAVSMLELVLHYRATFTGATETTETSETSEITGSPKASLGQGGVTGALSRALDKAESIQSTAEDHEARLSLAYPFAEYTADGLLALCRLQLERFTLAAPVVALTLHRCHFSPRSAPPAGAIENSHRASLSLLARLEARLGQDRVKRLGARKALLPEHSFCLQPMSAPVAVAYTALPASSLSASSLAAKPSRQQSKPTPTKLTQPKLTEAKPTELKPTEPFTSSMPARQRAAAAGITPAADKKAANTAGASNVIHTAFTLTAARAGNQATSAAMDGANDDSMTEAITPGLTSNITATDLTATHLADTHLTAKGLTAANEPVTNKAATSDVATSEAATAVMELSEPVTKAAAAKPATTQNAASEGLSLACRPPWLLVTPEAIAETDVELLRGPERLREPWWHGSQAMAAQSATELGTGQVSESLSSGNPMGAARDYYLARHHEGGLCWVFRREGEPGLYLQGWF